MFVHDHAETPFTITVKWPSAIAEVRNKGIAPMQQGIAKGGLKRPHDASLHLGVALLRAGLKGRAAQVLKTVGGNDGTADLARRVAADAKLTHCAEVNLTHLGEADGLLAVDVDPGASSGDTSDGPQGRDSAGDRAAAGLFAQHRAPVSA